MPEDSVIEMPHELMDQVYNPTDFQNEFRHIPPYWEDAKTTERHSEVKPNSLTRDIAGDDDEDENKNSELLPHFGPCYLPSNQPDWETLIKSNVNISSEEDISYHVNAQLRKGNHGNSESESALSGLCRPGFIIIGAGKCGTSSLYHYLVGHPRILPAKNKQIRYFNFTKRPMKWYLSNFPPATTFLSSGALMTGEASPGYLPYPDVAERLRSWMHKRAGNGIGQPVGSPKIIAIVRNPLERSWSSYNYNYAQPTISKLRKKNTNDPKNQLSDDYYRESLFSFEDMVRAELKELKKCLAPGGIGEMDTKKRYGKKTWANAEFKRRKKENFPPLVSLDDSCYGGRVSRKVPRRQWKKLVDHHPNKEINVENLHLVQSLVGRSLYTLPLEWWYALYPKDELYLFCSEDLRYRTSESMSDLSGFLGLPSYNFTDVVDAGMYNVGSNTGYDTVTSWTDGSRKDDIPISDELRKEYLAFVKPFNDRLFEMSGKRCNW